MKSKTPGLWQHAPNRLLVPATLLLVGWMLQSGFAAAEQVEQSQREFLRGVVVSCPRAGQIWGSPEMARSLEEITALGADWVAIHPYARVEKDGSIRYRSSREADYLQRAARLTREAGVKLFWKPHLAYWGNFEWRGSIEFGDDPEAWRRFFDGYRAFIVDQARFAESVGVDLLAVGVEYEQTTHHESEWRQIIAAVRSVFTGRLTYAANWDSLQRVPFWDALDLIGVHAYFPLSQEEFPDRSAIWQGWEKPLAKLAQLSQSLENKPVLFAEIGYSRSPRAATEPWVPDVQTTPLVLSLRRTLIEVAVERIEAVPYVVGMFWWKWIPGDDRWDRDFSMRDEEARQAVQRHWGEKKVNPATAQ